MDPQNLCSQLLALGREGDYVAISALPGAGTHEAVLRLAGTHRSAVQEFFLALSPADRTAFIKAVATYEDSVNGLGSVTLLQHLLPHIDDSGHEVLDWILRNTRSYWYYAYGARSYEDYVAQKRWRAEQTASNIHRDHERQARDTARIAIDATAKLYNAVRRGDLKAVQALLLKGADAEAATPEGESLVSFAIQRNRQDIATALQHFHQEGRTR